MAIHYRTQGFILKKNNLGESNQLFTIYAKDFGKLKVLARAIRKIGSKLRSGVDLFYLSDVEFIQGKIYKTLTDAIAIEKFQNIRKDLKKLAIVYKISEILDNLVAGEEPDKKIWMLLTETFERLNSSEIRDSKLDIIFFYFFWNLASALGYQPEIGDNSIQGRKVNCDIIKILKVILKKDWRILSRLKLEPIHQKLLKNISRWYYIKTVKI